MNESGPLGEAGARLRALVAQWMKESQEMYGDGCKAESCCGLTRRNDASELQVVLDALLVAPVVTQEGE
jgi:hypothetical protein